MDIRHSIRAAVSAAIMVGLAGAALAQSPGTDPGTGMGPRGGAGMGQGMGQGMGPSSAMHQSMMRNMQDMQRMQPSGDVDRDFLMMMRRHHQSGIEMARQEVENGKDAEAKRLARKIIEGQEREVKEIDRLLERQGGKSPGTGTGAGSGAPR